MAGRFAGVCLCLAASLQWLYLKTCSPYPASRVTLQCRLGMVRLASYNRLTVNTQHTCCTHCRTVMPYKHCFWLPRRRKSPNMQFLVTCINTHGVHGVHGCACTAKTTCGNICVLAELAARVSCVLARQTQDTQDATKLLVSKCYCLCF